MLQLMDLAKENSALKCELERVRQEAKTLRLRLEEDGAPTTLLAKSCLECGARKALTCSKCRVDLPGGAKLCLECWEPVGPQGQIRSPEF